MYNMNQKKIILWEGVKLDKVSLHAPKKIRAGKYEKDLQEQTRALLKITYTPDFIIVILSIFYNSLYHFMAVF